MGKNNYKQGAHSAQPTERREAKTLMPIIPSANLNIINPQSWNSLGTIKPQYNAPVTYVAGLLNSVLKGLCLPCLSSVIFFSDLCLTNFPFLYIDHHLRRPVGLFKTAIHTHLGRIALILTQPDFSRTPPPGVLQPQRTSGWGGGWPAGPPPLVGSGAGRTDPQKTDTTKNANKHRKKKLCMQIPSVLLWEVHFLLEMT